MERINILGYAKQRLFSSEDVIIETEDLIPEELDNCFVEVCVFLIILYVRESRVTSYRAFTGVKVCARQLA